MDNIDRTLCSNAVPMRASIKENIINIYSKLPVSIFVELSHSYNYLTRLHYP